MDVASEYANQLKSYMKRFGLHNVDIAYLANTNRDVVSGILKGEKGIVLKTLEAISTIFSLRYFEFGNPAYPMPNSEQLSEKTRKRIAFRKKEGLPKEIKYIQSEINDRINLILASYNIGQEFLAEEIANSINEKYGALYSISEIIDRFKKSFTENIKKTGRKDTERKGRGPKPVYYRLVIAIANESN